MMMVFAIGSGMAETIVEAGALPEKSVPVPNTLVIIGHAVIGVKDAHAIAPHPGMTESYSCCIASCGLRITRDLKNKVLILRHIGI